MLFFILEGNDYNFNMKREGQAFIIVVIVFGLIVSVFAISISTAMRSQALEETEIYQREQALYLAQMGINQMIYNINNGTTYTNGQSINGTSPDIGTYKATYYTPDTSGYNGIAYIKSEGTVGLYTRVIYASLQGSGSTEVFKYCLYSENGGNDSVRNINNQQYPSYTFNSSAGVLPTVNINSYESIADSFSPTNPPVIFGTSCTYTYTTADSGKLLFFDNGGTGTDLTINFTGSISINLSIATNYPNVTISAGLDGTNTITWNPVIKNIGGSDVTFPILVHNPSSTSTSFTIDFSDLKAKKDTLLINGFIFSNSISNFDYYEHGAPKNSIRITGELMVKGFDPKSPIGGKNGDRLTITRTIFSQDYFLNPPPYFNTSTVTQFLPSSFREEY